MERGAFRRLTRATLGFVFVLGCNAIVGLEPGELKESVGGNPCSLSSDCDDSNPCTADACTEGQCARLDDDGATPDDGNECTADTCVKGAERHTAQQGLACGEGGMLTCNAQGQCAGCMSPDQCGAPSECETWGCDAMICVADLLPMGTELTDPTPSDCKTMACDGRGNAVVVSKDDDLPPDDGVECTESQCNGGEPTFPQSPPDTVCTDTISYCNTLGACVPCTATVGCVAGQTCFNETGCVSCDDAMQNGDETGVDCGGTSCLACVGEDCGGNADCVSTFCTDGFCCDTDCTGVCRRCDFPGHEGTCTFLPSSMDDPDPPSCTGIIVCNGAGICVADQGKAHYGEPCNLDSECFNDTCDGDNFCRLVAGDPCTGASQCESDICDNGSNTCD